MYVLITVASAASIAPPFPDKSPYFRVVVESVDSKKVSIVGAAVKLVLAASCVSAAVIVSLAASEPLFQVYVSAPHALTWSHAYFTVLHGAFIDFPKRGRSTPSVLT